MSRRSIVLRWAIAAFGSVLATVIAAAYWHSQASGSADRRRAAIAGGAWDPAATESGDPVRIAPIRPPLLELPREQLRQFSFRIRPPADRKVPVSYYLHVLRMHGLDGRFDHPVLTGGREVLRLLIDEPFARSFFGAPVVTRTRHGVQFVGASLSYDEHELASETHRDQCLATLAELGLPLSTPLRMEGGDLTLRAALADSLANFHLKQEEFPWTAIAYALYLPPRREWMNKFGEHYTFDDLVDRLLTTPFEAASCGGTHLGYALTLVYRVDREHAAILSPATRDRLKARLERIIAAALEGQSADGSWPLDWGHALHSRPGGARSADAASPASRLLATGHTAEWLLFLPPGYAAPEDRLRRAGLWLLSQVQEVRHDTVRDDVVCPYTHAACVLKALSPDRHATAAR